MACWNGTRRILITMQAAYIERQDDVCKLQNLLHSTEYQQGTQRLTTDFKHTDSSLDLAVDLLGMHMKKPLASRVSTSI